MPEVGCGQGWLLLDIPEMLPDVELTGIAIRPETIIERTTFVNQNVAGRYGAECSALPDTPKLEVPVKAVGKPAIVVRRVSKGQVYRVGYNLVWHTFLTDSEGERRLIRALFADAIASVADSHAAIGSVGVEMSP